MGNSDSGDENLGDLGTESSVREFESVDELSVNSLLALINREDRTALQSVDNEIPAIGSAVSLARARLEGNETASVVYIGTGTSGRLGALDAAEWPPTFGVSPDRGTAIIAGGERALTSAVEGIEDDPNRARRRVREEVSGDDVAFGISASGRTPYTVAALEEAGELGAATVALSCNPGTPLSEVADVTIVTETGPEVIAGSTRMKAGLATKAVLTMFSTALMVQLGHVQGNLMVDLEPANEKLRKRAIRIVTELTNLDEQTARQELEATDWDVREVIGQQTSESS